MKLFKTYLIIFLSVFFFNSSVDTAETDIYKKIDLFGEVLEKINKEYVDEINQSESMDSAINGRLQSLDPYPAYMSPKILGDMYAEYGSSDCKRPLIAESMLSDWSISSTYSLLIFSKTSPKRSIFL